MTSRSAFELGGFLLMHAEALDIGDGDSLSAGLALRIFVSLIVYIGMDGPSS